MDGTTTQREVVMKMSAKADPSLTAPIKELSRATKDADAESDKYEKTLKRISSSIAAIGESLKKAFRTGVNELDQLNAKLEKFDAKFRNVAKAGLAGNLVSVDASRLNVKKDESGGLADSFSKMSVALGGLAAGIKIADNAVRNYYQAVERQQFSMETFNRNIRRNFEKNTPVVGEAMRHSSSSRFWSLLFGVTAPTIEEFQGASTQTHSTAQEEYLNFRSQQNIGISAAQAQARRQTAQQQAALQMQLTGHLGEQLGNIGLSRAGIAITGTFGAARQAAVSSATGQFGYGRREQLEDTLRALGFSEQRERAKAESQAHITTLSARQMEAESQAKRFGELHQRSANSLQARRLRKRLEPFTELHRINDRLAEMGTGGDAEERQALKARQKELQGKTKGTTIEQELRMRNQLQALDERTAQFRDAANTSQQQALDAQLQKANAIADAQKRQTDIMREQLSAAYAISQQEKSRLKDLNEELGLAHPMQLRQAARISDKVKRGQIVTEREKQFMVGHRGWFGQQVGQVAAQRAANPMTAGYIKQIMQNTGQYERGKAAEKQIVELKHQLQINVNANEAVIAKASQAVGKAFHEAMAKIDAQLNNMLQRIENAKVGQARAQYGAQ